MFINWISQQSITIEVNNENMKRTDIDTMCLSIFPI